MDALGSAEDCDEQLREMNRGCNSVHVRIHEAPDRKPRPTSDVLVWNRPAPFPSPFAFDKIIEGNDNTIRMRGVDKSRHLVQVARNQLARSLQLAQAQMLTGNDRRRRPCSSVPLATVGQGPIALAVARPRAKRL